METAASLKSGVVYGQELSHLLRHANENGYALPAVNVISSHTVNGVLETASKVNSPVIVQFSNGGAQFFAGKGLDNSKQQASIAGGISGAHHVHLMAEAYNGTSWHDPRNRTWCYRRGRRWR